MCDSYANWLSPHAGAAFGKALLEFKKNINLNVIELKVAVCDELHELAENLEEEIPDSVEEVAGVLAAPAAALISAGMQSRRACRESQAWRVRQLALLGVFQVRAI